MTIELLAKCIKLQRITYAQKLMLIVMADNTNVDGKCYLTRQQIAEETGYCDRNSRRVLKELRSLGLVKTVDRRIFLTIKDAKIKVSEPPESPIATPAPSKKTNYSPDFEDWWRLYPRKQNASKLLAFRAYCKIISNGDCNHLILMKKTNLFCEQMRNESIEYIPHPATWLNGHRYDTVDEVDNKRRENLNHYAG